MILELERGLKTCSKRMFMRMRTTENVYLKYYLKRFAFISLAGNPGRTGTIPPSRMTV